MNKRENIGWVDFLRVLACFLVVFSHSCDAFVAQFNNDYTTFLWGCSLGSMVRPYMILNFSVAKIQFLSLYVNTSVSL